MYVPSTPNLWLSVVDGVNPMSGVINKNKSSRSKFTTMNDRKMINV